MRPLPALRHSNPCVQKVDRLAWRAGFAFTLHGTCFGVRTTAPGLLRALGKRLPPDAKPSPRRWVDSLYSVMGGDDPAVPARALRRFHLLYVNALRFARTMDVDEVLDAFESALELDLAARATRRVFVHAGVVSWRGRVQPFARPLRVRRDGNRTERILAARIGARTGKTPLPVGLILSTRYKAGVRFRPRSLSYGQAVMELLANTVPARLRPRQSVATITSAARSARALKGVRGEADVSVSVLLSRYLQSWS